MGDYGIKVSKPGYDIDTAGDTDLLLSSSWPTLQIILEKPASIVLESSGIPDIYVATTNHNLGFPPLASIWAVYDNGVIMRIMDLERDTGALADNLEITNSTALIRLHDFNGNFHITSVIFKFYNINLSKNIDYPSLKLPVKQTNINRDFGIKISKENKSVYSTDLRDYILHSRCQSPLVLAVRTQNGSGVTVTGSDGSILYTNSYPFLSWVFGFVKSTTGVYKSAPYFSQAYPTTSIFPNVNTYSIGWDGAAGDDGATLVILRDPFFAASNIEASY